MKYSCFRPFSRLRAALTLLVSSAASVSVVTPAAAAPDDEEAARQSFPNPTRATPPRYQIGLSLLKEHGTGVTARIRSVNIVGEIAYAFVSPVLIFSPGELEVELPFHADAGVAFLASPSNTGTQHGLRVAAIYDTFLRGGGMVGWVMDRNSERFGWSLGAGAQVYPEAERVLRDRYPNASRVTAVSSVVQPYVGFTLMWNAR